MPARRGGAPKRTQKLDVRLTVVQMRAIERAAIKAHLDLSAFARVALAELAKRYGVIVPMPLW